VKYLTEFADPALARQLLDEISRRTTREWAIMEVCGGQTHAIIRNGIDQLLPEGLELIHGPGCPVCVTPVETIDQALQIAARPEVIFCTFGDMLRVPGSEDDLLSVRAAGGDVRIVYSPLDAVTIAEQNAANQVVFFAVGFETTAPANAMAVHQARKRELTNFSVLVSHVLVPPAIEAIASAPDSRVDAFLAAGHVCTVMGIRQYEPIAAKYQVPIVVTGFEPLDVLDGIRHAVDQLESGRAEVENAYSRAVRADGNQAAQRMLGEVFEITDRQWRGIGPIPASGWRLTPEYRDFDAEMLFEVDDIRVAESSLCRSGDVLLGLIKPHECEAFGTTCTPRHPLGATMVSSEGACAAYYRYRRLNIAGGAG
jgi:hydrogenase expression/formation protein HypD